MLGITCPDRHALPLTPPKNARTVARALPRERVRSVDPSRPLSLRSGNGLFLPPERTLGSTTLIHLNADDGGGDYVATASTGSRAKRGDGAMRRWPWSAVVSLWLFLTIYTT